MARAIRQLQEVRRPVLMVCVEEVPEKIGCRPHLADDSSGDGEAARSSHRPPRPDREWRWCQTIERAEREVN